MKRNISLLALFAAVLLGAGFYVIPVSPPGVGIRITSLPYTITKPGFYYLGGNLTTSGTGITINANDVTIDLMGCTISGPGSGTNYGIYMNGRSNIEIRNGAIRNFGNNGIYEPGSGTHHRCLNLRVLDNKNHGIFLGGYGHIVEGCTVSNNVEFGMFAGNMALIRGNLAYHNGNHGMYVNGSLVTHNACVANGQNGYGMNIGPVTSANMIIENYAP